MPCIWRIRVLDFTDGSIANGIMQPACVLESKLLAASGVSAQYVGVARHSIVPCLSHRFFGSRGSLEHNGLNQLAQDSAYRRLQARRNVTTHDRRFRACSCRSATYDDPGAKSRACTAASWTAIGGTDTANHRRILLELPIGLVLSAHKNASAVHSSRTLSTDSADVMKSSMPHCLLQMDKLIRYKSFCYSLHLCVMDVPVRQIFLQDILMDEVEIITSEGSTSQQGQIVRLHLYLGPLYTLSTATPDGCNAVCHS